MTESHIIGWIAGGMQFLVAGYALRLDRRYGTARVGWSLFCAFSLLAILQLVQSCTSTANTVSAALEINGVYVLISFLLFIGMLHLEAMLKERMRNERVERDLRANLESEVKAKTAHLTRAIEELMTEMEQTRRMSEIIETSHWTKGKSTFLGHAEAVPVPVPIPAIKIESKQQTPSSNEEIIAGILAGELAAHF